MLQRSLLAAAATRLHGPLADSLAVRRAWPAAGEAEEQIGANLLGLAHAIAGPCYCWPMLWLAHVIFGPYYGWPMLWLAHVIFGPCYGWPMLWLAHWQRRRAHPCTPPGWPPAGPRHVAQADSGRLALWGSISSPYARVWDKKCAMC